MPKCFLLNIFSRTQISEISSSVVHLSGPYSKIWTVQGTNQNAPFHHGPVQPYNKSYYSTNNTHFLSLKETFKTPAPGAYSPEKVHPQGERHAPAYSMAARTRFRKRKLISTKTEQN